MTTWIAGCSMASGDSYGIDWKYPNNENSEDFIQKQAEKYDAMFYNGCEESIRPLVVEILDDIRNGEIFEEDHPLHFMHKVHPDALDVLIKYGVDFVPFVWPRALPEPSRGRCHENAITLMNADQGNPHKREGGALVYVEGIAMGAAVHPAIHAWNTPGIKGTVAIDWTHDIVCKWSRYLGIALEKNQLRELCILSGVGGTLHAIFCKECFNDKLKKRLIEILEERKAST